MTAKEKRERDAVEGGEAHAASLEEGGGGEELRLSIREGKEVKGGGGSLRHYIRWRHDDKHQK